MSSNKYGNFKFFRNYLSAYDPKNTLFKKHTHLRTFARKFSNIDFFLKILPLKDDELVMSEM